MAELKLSTLSVCLQAVQKQTQQFEALLKSETVRDKAEIREVLVSLGAANENLKELNANMREKDRPYPGVAVY